jgi:hypothetical protein
MNEQNPPQPTDTQSTEQVIPEVSVQHIAPQVEQEYLILSWTAPNRAYKKHDREYYTTIAVIVVLLSVILFFAGQFLPIAVVISAAFLSYVLAAIPPHTVEHQVTTYGIRTLDRLYPWGELGRFWFSERFKQRILNIEHLGSLPPKFLILLGNQKEEEVQAVLSQYLVNQTPLPTFLDKASVWLQEKIPLEKNSESSS